jgi:hypothetical protein
MIEFFRFPDKFWMFGQNPEHCHEPWFFLLSSCLLARAVTGKEYCTLTLVYACKNLSVVTAKDLWKKKVRNGFLFHSHSSSDLPMNREKIHMAGFTSAACTSAVPRSRQARPAVQQA